jgi:penicillin-insensitive murein endopeptidase
MRRARFLGAIFFVIACALPAVLAAKQPTKVPAPVAVKTDAVPAPEQKDSTTDAKDGSATDAADSPAADSKNNAKGASKPDPKSKKTAGKKKDNSPVAKTLFGVQKTASPLAARAVGWYSKGCLSGGVHLDDAGSAWQTMRPSRNRAWGHPKLIALLKRLANDAKQKDGWSGLLVGDISQPRGGPMLSGHASHQVGLDADIWFNPMPDHVMSVREREDISAKTMLDSTKLKVDPKIFTDKQVALLKLAASYPEVERIFVNPAIKKALCERSAKDRHWLGKVRPMWGHDYHFHIRIGCTNSGCTSQPVPNGDDGCGKEVDNWLKMAAKSLSKEEPKPGQKMGGGASDMRMVTMNQLPAECKTILNSPGYIAVAPGTKLPTFLDAAAPPEPAAQPAPAAAAKAAANAAPANAAPAEMPLPAYRGVAPAAAATASDPKPAEPAPTSDDPQPTGSAPAAGAGTQQNATVKN